ncbi:MAG: DUF3108 domain-containing protein [Candidatus Omnitrophica bacterium]|nr:DUF3108 domain-containing protein [Candidatus Omnitrophota bacterium]
MRRFIPLAIWIILSAGFLSGCTRTSDEAGMRKGEKLVYDIKPAGSAVYHDRGIVERAGKKMHLTVFKADILGFHDTENIYSDQETMLPLYVDREVSLWLKKEKIIEEYDQEHFILTVTKYRGDKKISERTLKKTGPIHNAVLLPFLLRGYQDFPDGWEMPVRLTKDFNVQFEGREVVTVPAGKFDAYHFKSSGNTFEAWISSDTRRIPLRIRGLGKLGYSLELKGYSVK